MPARVDALGMKFGRLVVTEKRGSKWLCKCECGKEITVDYPSLKKGNTKSCGCSRHSPRPNRMKGPGRNTRLYRIWTNIKTRCSHASPTNAYKYSRYGGRGISVCDEWKDFDPFYEWAVNNGYGDSLTIDRINNDGNYQPDNCRWATMKEQCENRKPATRRKHDSFNTLASSN